jgi:hypothetical protein
MSLRRSALTRHEGLAFHMGLNPDAFGVEAHTTLASCTAMDPLTDCVEALRALAKEPFSGNQVLMAEYRITEFLGTKVANRKSALERLRKAIDAEAAKEPRAFWDRVRDYVNSLLVKAGVA